nr:hypothetical protein [uncultured Cohaesibacter sp.]
MPETENIWYRLKLLAFPWLRFDPHSPPGPIRGDKWGEPSHTTSLAFDAEFDGLDVTCRISYHYDPACCLDALIFTKEGYHLYSFETRAYSLQYAFAHLAQSTRAQHITVPLAGLATKAKWHTRERNCDQLSLGPLKDIHPCTILQQE